MGVADRLDLVLRETVLDHPEAAYFAMLTEPLLTQRILTETVLRHAIRSGGAPRRVHEATLHAGRQGFIELEKIEWWHHPRI